MAERSPGAKRDRLTGIQRVLLEQMRDHGPQTPNSLLRAKTYGVLVERGHSVEKDDGSYELTAKGLDALGTKMGRPTKFTGPWLVLVEHYGGPEKFASEVGVAYVTVNRWALHESEPSGPARNMIRKLAQEAGLPDPLEKTG